MQLNRERLGALREVLEDIFESGWKLYCDGEERIGRIDLPDNDTLASAVKQMPNNYGLSSYDKFASNLSNRCFPLFDDEFRRSALLKYLTNLDHESVTLGKQQNSWWRLVESCGGIRWLAPRMGGDGKTLSAAQGIILIDTGFNVQPCDDLLSDPIRTRAKRGKQTLSTVTSNKMRAGGKLVLAVLREYEAQVPIKSAQRISALQVISRWRAMSALFRRHAELKRPELAKFLWIRAPFGNLASVQVSPCSYYHWVSLQGRIDQHPALRGLRISKRSIRATVLQMRLSEAGLDVAAATLVAGHSRQTTTVRHYFNRGWFHSEMDELIRRFQENFEAILLPQASYSPLQIPLTPNQIQERRNAAVENGLGLLCAAPPPSQHSKTKRCLALEQCSGCEMMRFAPTESAMRALVLAERSLSAAQETFASQNPERWARYWLPTLALSRAIIGRLVEGHHRLKLEAAAADVDNGIASGAILAIRPW